MVGGVRVETTDAPCCATSPGQPRVTRPHVLPCCDPQGNPTCMLQAHTPAATPRVTPRAWCWQAQHTLATAPPPPPTPTHTHPHPHHTPPPHITATTPHHHHHLRAGAVGLHLLERVLTAGTARRSLPCGATHRSAPGKQGAPPPAARRCMRGWAAVAVWGLRGHICGGGPPGGLGAPSGQCGGSRDEAPSSAGLRAEACATARLMPLACAL
jgi:hypothetical protein